MKIIETPLQGCLVIENTIIKDERGYFFESFNHQKFQVLTGMELNFVQDNQSESTYGVVRGLHFQQGKWAQAKLVRVLQGTVLDVAVDMRPGSSTFGQYLSIELSGDNARQLFIPRGFAHGFSVLSPTATFFYKCDNYYNKASEGGVYPLDGHLGIDWKVPAQQIILSQKDKEAMRWEQVVSSGLDATKMA